MKRLFFATADDLLPIFDAVELRSSLCYSIAGNTSEPIQFTTGRSLPSLRAPAPGPAAVHCPRYLVTLATSPVKARPVGQFEVRYVVDQLWNQDSVAFTHGGFYGDNVLLYGSVGSAHKTTAATQLHRAFGNALKKHFTRVNAFWVGPEAFQRWKQGWRLTVGANSPKEFDLAMGTMAAE